MRPIREVMTITVILPLSVTCRMMVLREPLSHLANARGWVLDERFEVEPVMFTESLSRRCLHFAPCPESRFTGQASCFVVFPTHLLRVNKFPRNLAMNRLSQAATLSFLLTTRRTFRSVAQGMNFHDSKGVDAKI